MKGRSEGEDDGVRSKGGGDVEMREEGRDGGQVAIEGVTRVTGGEPGGDQRRRRKDGVTVSVRRMVTNLVGDLQRKTVAVSMDNSGQRMGQYGPLQSTGP